MSKPKRKKGWKPRRGALWIIALMLLASGGLRIATGTGVAVAREVEAMLDEAQGNGEPPVDMAAEACGPEGKVDEVLKALGERSEALDKREAALADRIAALNLAEQEIEKNLVALQKAEEELSSTLALADSAAEDDLARLTAVYENMKPKEASALFEEMAPEFAAGFLGRMRPDAAATIMAGLSAPTAYTISVLLAGRNANVPTQ